MERTEIKPSLPKKLYDKIEEDVAKLHIELELSIPITPNVVARLLGYVVRFYSELNPEEVDLNDIRVGNDGRIRDGLSYFDPVVGTYIIWVNNIDYSSLEHNGFTVMHEIGHIRMGHYGDSALAEMIANYYAAYALVPSPLPGLYQCHDFVDIIDTFGVSMGCAFNCSKRCIKWDMYSGISKPYEKDLMEYYKKVIEGGRCS